MSDNKTLEQLQQQLIEAMWKEGMAGVKGLHDAFLSVPRHIFLPGVPLDKAYADEPIALKYDTHGLVVASSSQPSMMAIMLDQLGLKAGHNVLEIGTASGYNAAIMQYLVGKNGRVTTVELEKDLAEQAERNLMKANMGHVRVVHADGSHGYAPRATYDRIIATVGIWDVPTAWVRQLRDDGVLLAPIWLDGLQVSAKFTKQADGTLYSADNRGCMFVYMRGNEAFPDTRKQVGSSSLYIISDSVRHIDTIRLHTLLSDDYGICNLDRLTPRDYWDGFQLYLMLNVPKPTHFVLYAIEQGARAYGMEGQGLALILPTSAAFAPYKEIGVSHCFGGIDAYMMLQESLDAWNAQGRLSMRQLRLRLIPKEGKDAPPSIENGRLYDRRHHYLHVWTEPTTPPAPTAKD